MHASPDCQRSSDVAVTVSQRSSSPADDGGRSGSADYWNQPSMSMTALTLPAALNRSTSPWSAPAHRVELHDRQVRQHLPGAQVDVRGDRRRRRSPGTSSGRSPCSVRSRSGWRSPPPRWRPMASDPWPGDRDQRSRFAAPRACSRIRHRPTRVSQMRVGWIAWYCAPAGARAAPKPSVGVDEDVDRAGRVVDAERVSVSAGR